jgi:hypothetical protein
MNLTFPTSAELKEIEQAKLPVLTKDDPTFQLFPMTTEDTDTLLWEQRDNFTGVQAARGLNGQPGRVRRVGAKRYQAEVGYYGDFEEIDEEEITKARKLGTFGERANLDYLVSWKQDYLLQREVDRMRLMVWTLMTTGAYTALTPDGAMVHTDTYPLQTANAAVAWATVATATPLVDFRALKILARGYSTRFDGTATAYMNLTTANNLLNNTNANDLFGKRQDVGATFNSIVDVNKVLAAQDLPRIQVYDDTYFVEGATTPTLFIPNNKVVVVGTRKNGPRSATCARPSTPTTPTARPAATRSSPTRSRGP